MLLLVFVIERKISVKVINYFLEKAANTIKEKGENKSEHGASAVQRTFRKRKEKHQ